MKKMIVIDDDLPILDAFRIIFESEDFDITTYTDGTNIINGDFRIPDVFVLDKQLSGLDGIELCKLLKSRNDTQNIPVVILSAASDIDKVAKAAGAAAVLHKPFKIKTLRDCIRKQVLRQH